MRRLLLPLLFVLMLQAGVAGTFAPGWVYDYGNLISGEAQNDDGVSQIDLGFSFTFFGQSYAQAYVSSNGFVQFGGSGGSLCCNGNVSSFLSGFPMIAVGWTDLYPPGGNGVYLNTSAGLAVITWAGLPECCVVSNTETDTTFQLQLRSSGGILLSYYQFSVPGTVSSHTALVGLTAGGGASDPGETDLINVNYPTALTGTVYQVLAPGSSGPSGPTGPAADIGSGNYNFSGASFAFAPDTEAPEPGTLGFLLAGGAALIGFKRRRQ
jgi:hypothetical protein